jgi:hypothetical protein
MSGEVLASVPVRCPVVVVTDKGPLDQLLFPGKVRNSRENGKLALPTVNYMLL